MRRISVINQKGGVGKTTTVINLAAGLAQRRKRVLVIDLDPQGNVNSTFCLPAQKTAYHLLAEGARVRDCICSASDYLDVIPGGERLVEAEAHLGRLEEPGLALRTATGNLSDYDYLFIDCPPSINLLNLNALLASHEAFVPVSTEYLSLDALRKTEARVQDINKEYGHHLSISMIVPTMYDKRIKSNIRVLRDIKRGYNGLVAQPIGVNSKLKEAPGAAQNVLDYAKSSRGAKDYQRLAERVIEGEYY